MTSVSLIRCERYDQPELDQAVFRAVDLLGGISRFVKPGDRVLLKPNLLAARAPEKRVTTDPGVVRAVARMVVEAGGRPFIADSPAIESFRKVAQITEMDRVAEELGIELREMERSIPVAHGGRGLFRKLELSADALEADVVINLPKLKTHSQMLLTLGVKNLFGTVVAQRKAEWHYMVGVNRDTFASLLLEIYRSVNPALTILDGVWGMEGHGPSNGRPRQLNLIGASIDAVALDVSVCNLLGDIFERFSPVPGCERNRDRRDGPRADRFSWRRPGGLLAYEILMRRDWTRSASCRMFLTGLPSGTWLPSLFRKRTRAPDAGSARRSARRRPFNWVSVRSTLTTTGASVVTAARKSVPGMPSSSRKGSS